METICATGVRVSEVRFITVEALRELRADITLKGKVRSILLPQKLCRIHLIPPGCGGSVDAEKIFHKEYNT